MTDMIERVARAIYPHVAWAYRYAPGRGYDGLNDHAKETLAGFARAAIEAMREPTEAMLDASDAAVWKHITDPRPSRTAWLAMIDAALNPAGEPK